MGEQCCTLSDLPRSNKKILFQSIFSPNDDPHGVFAVYNENQAIKIDDNGRRYLLLNVSRLAGTDGDVRVRWGLVYNQVSIMLLTCMFLLFSD